MAKTLFPITKTIVPKPAGGFSTAYKTFVKRASSLYPITHKFVAAGDDWLDNFKGGILEYYNWLPGFTWGYPEPWGYESTGMNPPNSRYHRIMYGKRSIDMTFAYRGFGTDPNHPWLPWTHVNDAFGFFFSYRAADGEMVNYDIMDGTAGGWTAMLLDYIANGGGRGIFMSPNQQTPIFEAWDTEYPSGNDILLGNPHKMPLAHTAPNTNGIVHMTDSISTNGTRSGFGYFMENIQCNFLMPHDRGHDMVMWVYDCAVEGGHSVKPLNPGDFHPSELVDWNSAEGRFDYKIRDDYQYPAKYKWFMGDTAVITDELCPPGMTWVTYISNDYKYAPWERYPNL